MNGLPTVDTAYLLNLLTELLNTPSPTGFTHQAIALCERHLSPHLKVTHTRKGALVAEYPGEKRDSPRALTAHVDTLGAMVKEIKANGRLKMTKVGNYAWNTVEGEGCVVFTNNGGIFRGSILLTEASSHVYGTQVNETRRDDESMEVRLDALTTSASETRSLGISVGDYISFDPRVESNNNFIRSRHLDDKACVACIIAAVKSLLDASQTPNQTTYLHISNYEEVGHGASAGIPPEVTEVVCVDMAAIGEGQTSDEFHPSICMKDSGGPYHYELSQRLRQLADEYQISHKVDIYPHYGSDGGAFWRAGGDVAVALIGPGVDASHSYERTHLEALVGTTQWLMAYLLH